MAFALMKCSQSNLFQAYLSMNWSTKSSNSAEAEHISLSTWNVVWKCQYASIILPYLIWKNRQWFTSVKSVLSCRADEQSTKGTSVTNVAINWNVICRDRSDYYICVKKFNINKGRQTLFKLLEKEPTMHLLKSFGSTPGRARMSNGSMWVGPSGKRCPPDTRLRATPIMQLRVAVSWWGSVRVSRAG